MNETASSVFYIKRFSLISIFILLFCTAGFAQNQPALPCPDVSLKLDKGAHITAEQILDVIVDVANYDRFSLKYIWKLTNKNNILFSGESEIPYSASFRVTEEMDDSILTATVEIKGLPANCKSIYTESFKLTLGGDPPVIGHYKNSTFAKEKIELDSVAAYFKDYSKEYKDAILVFVIFCPEIEFKKRTARISNYLLQRHNISSKRLTYLIGPIKSSETQVYILPKDNYAKDRK